MQKRRSTDPGPALWFTSAGWGGGIQCYRAPNNPAVHAHQDTNNLIPDPPLPVTEVTYTHFPSLAAGSRVEEGVQQGQPRVGKVTREPSKVKL